ncbi:MAG: 8-amino-7-oxononanoate synthase [Gemmataceae bacterium]|nr:8-amino-7-oxononanoate synthase [Gemmataceae bacterium]MCI0738030.1 8-amino-7-oxononanoate synthase [Gemmataceae bacterium]
MNLEERWNRQLDELRRQGRYRQLTPPRGIDFCSNDYLGYGARTWGNAANLSQSGLASRLLRGHHEIWDDVEKRLADWHDAQAALMMSSGYMANLGLLSTVIEPGDWVASDECNHASLIDGIRLSKAEILVFRHNDEAQLSEAIHTAGEKSSPARHLFVVTESYFSMEADSGCALDKNTHRTNINHHVIIDEAHATGCFGNRGSGIVDAQLQRNKTPILASVHTGGKALGVPGAYICCSKLLREYLVNRCRQLLFTTALPPIVGQWWLEAIERVQKDDAGRARLHENAEVFRRALSNNGVEALGRHYIVPIVLGNDKSALRAAHMLQQQGFDIRAIRPPTVPQGTARLRVSIHADHDHATLHAAATAIGRVVRELLMPYRDSTSSATVPDKGHSNTGTKIELQ